MKLKNTTIIELNNITKDKKGDYYVSNNSKRATSPRFN